MGTAAPTIRPYNALNGIEIREIILSEIKRQLENDFRFRQNVAYPLISWSWKLAVNAYPLDPPQFEVNVADKVITAPGAEGFLPEGAVVEIDIGSSRDVTAPAGETADAARRSANISVPTPRSVKGPGGQRMVVDAPAIDLKGVPTEVSASAAQTNVPKGAGVFGRSVTARTKAAPDGAEVAPAAGSKPDEARAQQIADLEGKAPAE
jgi:hypothetical protein